MPTNFEEQLKGFKWEFGNEDHIRGLAMLERINKKKKLLAEKRKNSKVITNLLAEIKRDESSILYVIGIKK